MPRRLVRLDVLRAVAVLLVMWRHIGQGHNTPGMHALIRSLSTCPVDLLHAPTLVLSALFRAGWAGVDLFFVLSGFLVSGLLFREWRDNGTLQAGRFLLRRGFKIYPPFYFLLGGTVLLIVLTGDRPLRPAAIVSEACFVQNYGPSLWGHTWSLAVEEHFYILLCVGMTILTRRRARAPFSGVPWISAGAAALELTLRVATSWMVPEFDYKTHVFATHLRLDSLLSGVAVSYFYHFHPDALRRFASRPRALLVCSCALLGPALFVSQEEVAMRTIGLTGLQIGFSGVLLWTLMRPPTGSAAAKTAGAALGWLGGHSYAIYLWHVPMIAVGVPLAVRICGDRLGLSGELTVYVLGSLAAGIGTAKLIERPILKLRDRLAPSRAVQLGEATSTDTRSGRAEFSGKQGARAQEPL